MSDQDPNTAAKLGRIYIPEHLLPAKQWLCVDYDSLPDDQAELVDEYHDFLADFANEVADANNLVTCWCYSTADFTAPYEDQTATSVEYDGGWGTPTSQPLPPNPTILDVWKAADLCIRLSGDQHHVFIEELTNNGSGALQLTTGS